MPGKIQREIHFPNQYVNQIRMIHNDLQKLKKKNVEYKVIVDGKYEGLWYYDGKAWHWDM